MRPQRSVCVFCGSASGLDPSHAEAAREVGAELARRGVRLVYGGGSIGLMGQVADACLEGGGEVMGIIPDSLARKEIAHQGLTELRVVGDMHVRKALMATSSDAFLTLPGGIGTFEEFFEVYSWAMLGIHAKPLGILNIKGYYDPLIRLLEHAVREGFLHGRNLELLRVSSEAVEVVGELLEAPSREPAGPIWMNLDQA